jgi:hypothetical protein
MGTYKLTRRYWTGKKIQDGAEKKYGAKNVSTLGHSQGAKLARDLGGKSKEIITINPAYLGEKQKENEYRIRSSADPVSGLLAPVNKLKEGISWLIGGKKKENYDKQNITIKADTLNPLTEHSYEILDRIHPDTIIGVPETPQDIDGGAIKHHLVQSVIFHKNKFTISSAKKWLKENGYKCPKVDEEPNTIRFRQISPITIKKQGYTEYHNKPLGNSGIILVIAYKHIMGGNLCDWLGNCFRQRERNAEQSVDAIYPESIVVPSNGILNTNDGYISTGVNHRGNTVIRIHHPTQIHPYPTIINEHR